MKMFEHDPELVGQLTELGLEKAEAIDCLRASQNDIGKAAELYFSGDLEKWRRNNTWDEGAFHRDRYDNILEPLEPLTGWGPQNLNVINNPPRTSTRSAAEFSHLSLPMRRYLEMQDTSRVGTPSDVGGEDHQHIMGDDDDMFGHDSERATAYSSSHSNVDYSIQGPDTLAPEVLGGPPRTRPSSPMNPGLDTDTNRDIARAIQMSLDDNYNSSDYDTRWGPQETGITGTHSTPTAPHFGPATRASYEESQWALTTLPVAHEIYLDPTHPSDRQRKDTEPAFFKPSSDGFHLGPALAILHSIPAAREALLAPHLAIDDYGYNERWWSGERIEASRITNIIETEGTEEVMAQPESSEVVIEVQRLMAFLDRTMRGYGSVDSLAKLPEVNEHLQGGQFATFFKKWAADIRQLSQLDDDTEPKPFTSAAVATYKDGKPKSTDCFQVLTIYLPKELVNAPGANIYNAIDQLVWPDEVVTTGDIYFENVSDVFCISVINSEASDVTGIGIDILADLYLDRYTAGFLELVKEMKSERDKIIAKIRNLEQREERLLHCRKSRAIVDTSTVGTTQLLEAVIHHFEYLALPSTQPDDESGDSPMETQEGNNNGFSFMAEQLKNISDRLKVRLEELAISKDKARRSLHELTTAYTSPETTPESAPPLRKHSLRGVFIDLSTTFIKIRTDVAEQSASDEWWCLSYPLQWEADPNTAAYKVIKVSEKEVLDAVKYTGQGNALLVYATEEAMQPRESDGKLPEPLKNFIEHDNIVFMTEVESAGDKGKRKRSAWWNNNNPIPRISVEDRSASMDGDPGPGTGVHQPPASPTDFEPTGSPAPSSPNAHVKKSSGEEWYTQRQVESMGELGGRDMEETIEGVDTWAKGEPTGRGWERMIENDSATRAVEEKNDDGMERRYDGNFVARGMSPFSGPEDGGWQREEPKKMGFERIAEDEDEEMRDAQHLEFVNLSPETGSRDSGGSGSVESWDECMKDKPYTAG